MERNCPNQIGVVLDHLQQETGLLNPGEAHREDRVVPTGFHDFDRMSGLHRGSLTILASRPAMGKSALASQIALHTALDCNLPTLIFSMDLSIIQMAIHLICQRGVIDTGLLRSGRLDSDGMRRVSETQNAIRKAPLFIDDTPALTAKKIHKRVEEFYFEHCVGSEDPYGPERTFGLVLVDGLQHMAPTYAPNVSDKACAKVMSGLRKLAHEFDVPVLVLSGLSRRLEKRKDKRPRLCDLPNAAIAEYADQIAFLYRDEYYHPETKDHGATDLIVSRSRYGRAGIAQLNFIGQFMRYQNSGSPEIVQTVAAE